MAAQRFSVFLFLTLFLSYSILSHQHQSNHPQDDADDGNEDDGGSSDATLHPLEQEAVYRALESVNSAVPWRSLFPDDLCLSAPHGVVCDYFPPTDDDDDDINSNSNFTSTTVPHVVELNFGFVSDYTPNPTCLPNATFPSSLSSLPRLKKLFFYNCFTQDPVSFPVPAAFLFRPTLEELVFIDNPSLYGPIIFPLPNNFTRLRRLIVSGSTRITGDFPLGITDLPRLQQLTISATGLSGRIPLRIGNLDETLRVLDLSNNALQGSIPDTVGNLKNLLKLDLSSNKFSGIIPETFAGLPTLEFLDLSNNSFEEGSGIPLFLGQLPSLKDVYLSGNRLGGEIPETIWQNKMEGGSVGVLRIGLSGLGLVGKIPPSMAAFLRNAVYVALDNNSLEGAVPREFGRLERVLEMNLENNRLAGELPFDSEFAHRLGNKLRLRGNPDLCYSAGTGDLEKGILIRDSSTTHSLAKLKPCTTTLDSGFAHANRRAADSLSSSIFSRPPPTTTYYSSSSSRLLPSSGSPRWILVVVVVGVFGHLTCLS